MSLINVENLTFSYPSSYDNIFENVSFHIDTDWKLGFIGRNGRGKTTFLKLLLGQYEYRGKITASVKFDYFPVQISDADKPTLDILREVRPEAGDWMFLRELAALEVDDGALDRPFSTLSNGERTKVLLAALFLGDMHFPLIDEPTNHLDARARETVAAYLRRKKGFILVSHDRSFLDGCVDHILSLNRANIEVQSGNFSSWQLNFDRQQEFELAQNERLQKDISRLQKAARRSSSWSDKVEASKYGDGSADKGYIGHKSAKMMKRAKAIEQRQQQAVEQRSGLLRNLETTEKLKLFPLSYHSNTLVTAAELSLFYGERRVFDPITFSIQRGDRVALDGRNGSGKSSLLKLLTGEPIEHTGTLSIGSGIVISYVAQDTSSLSGTLSGYARECGIDETLFKSILRKMDFERVQFEKRIEDFSGGQKKKVLIARSLCQSAHLYVWDEPLNFIDIYSRIQIENLIEQFKPTMIFVEHDRTFREKISTKTLHL